MIEAVNVSKYYGPRRALTDVSFQIAPGEVVGLLGRNGAGKTTMLKVLCGLLLPSSGLVRVFGVDAVGDPRGLRERIGFLPDRPPLYPEMTVAQMLAYAGQLHRVSSARIGARVHAVLGQTGLADRADDLVETLSHGYRQRLGIAQAIVHEPKLVLLDEPISGLDPAQIISMRGLIRSLKDKHTVLLSSHILSEIEETCDRVILLHDGRVAAQGTEHELRSGAGATVELMIRGALEAVRASAASVVGLRDVEAQAAPGGLVSLRARVDNDQAREALVGALVHAGLGVRSVADVGGSLEALFMSVTERPMQSGGVA